MSSRVLRDDLWTSESINRLHDKTFRLYVCVINAADDYGLVETGFGHIRRAAPLTNWSFEDVSKMLGELFDAEVLLPYRLLDKTFAAVDKWQCFMRSVKPRCPIPSFGLGHVRMPYGFKNVRVRQAASLLLKHLCIVGDTPGLTQGVPGDDLGHEGSKELGVGNREEGKKGKRSKDKTTPRFALPDWVPKAEWDGWLESRLKLRKPPTDRAKQLAIRELEKLRDAGMAPAQVLDQSTANGWAGLFPLGQQRNRAPLSRREIAELFPDDDPDDEENP